MAKYIAVTEETRKLVSIVKIDEIKPIKKADFVEVAVVGGWQLVVKKGEFKAGDLALYAEIDSLLPIDNPVWAFLTERSQGIREFNGVKYSRIKTMKLRGEISQGLLTPLPAEYNPAEDTIGTNLTQRMGVKKAEEVTTTDDSLSSSLNAKGATTLIGRLARFIAGKAPASQYKPFPSELAKSDQDRVQNIGNRFAEASAAGEEFEVTYKLDGSSMTVFHFPDTGRKGICSRNYEVSMDDIVFTNSQVVRRFIASNLLSLQSGFKAIQRKSTFVSSVVKAGNQSYLGAIKSLLTDKYFYWNKPVKTIAAMNDLFVSHVVNKNILAKLVSYNTLHKDSISIQGELIGSSIQSNYEQVDDYAFYVYQVFRNGSQWVGPEEAAEIVASMGLNYIPVESKRITLPSDIKSTLKMAEGKGAFNPKVKREGVVFKSLTRDFSFKAISNNYLLDKEKAAATEE